MVAPSAVEICPKCRVRFVAGASPDPTGVRTRGKVCPNGHWSTYGSLQHSRRVEARSHTPEIPLPPPPPTVEEKPCRESAAMMRFFVVELLRAYRQALAGFPRGSLPRLMVEGAFERTVRQVTAHLETLK